MSNEHDDHEQGHDDNRSAPSVLDFAQIDVYVKNLIRQSPYAPTCHHDREDIAQEVQLKLARIAAKKIIHNLNGYLYYAVRNECITFLRHRKKELPTEDIEQAEVCYDAWQMFSWMMLQRAQDPALLYEMQMATADFIERLCIALLALPKSQRNAILCYMKRHLRQGEHAQLLLEAFQRHNIDISSIHWPTDPKKQQRIRSSYHNGYRRLARMLGIALPPKRKPKA